MTSRGQILRSVAEPYRRETRVHCRAIFRVYSALENDIEVHVRHRVPIVELAIRALNGGRDEAFRRAWSYVEEVAQRGDLSPVVRTNFSNLPAIRS